MGFSSREECTPESLRAARKLKALAVHPDKVGHDHPGANQAAGRVNKVRLLRCYTLFNPALSGVKVSECWLCTLTR
jgi:hypothetical protein